MTRKITEKYRSKFLGYLEYSISYMISLLFYTRSNKKILSEREKIREILIINLGHLGEMVLSTALIANVKDIFPEARITLMAGKWATPLMEDSGFINEILIYNSNLYNREFKKKLTFSESINFMVNLRRRKFDLIFDLRSDYWIMLYSIICTAKFRIDFGTVRIKKHLKKSILKGVEHYCLQYLDMLDEIKPIEKKTTLFLEVNDEDRKWVGKKFSDFGINSNDFIIIIHPFAEWKGREWGINNFAKVGDYLSSHHNARIIITGKKEDKGQAIEMMNLMGGNACNLVGETTLKELVALISKADLFICNDGGPMHIAAALNIPLVALFGPQTPLLFGPWSENNKVIYRERDCSPCEQRYCKKIPNCMELIKLEEVIDAIDELCNFF